VGYTLNTKNMTAGKMQVSVTVDAGNSGNIGFSVRTQTGRQLRHVAGGGENIRVLKTLTADSGRSEADPSRLRSPEWTRRPNSLAR